MKTRQAISVSAAIGEEHVNEILKSRARKLAQPLEAPQTNLELLHVLEFRLSRERYAIEQMHVREVHPLRELTPLPCTPEFLRGLVNVRGQILPVIRP
jgi:purine-binding chemotaxis protein CheW